MHPEQKMMRINCVYIKRANNKYVKKILFLQSQNTTKHKTKFITILQQHVSA